MATFNSAGSGNANADATWTEAGQPAAGDHAIIASGHTVTLTAAEAWGSTRIIGTLAGGGYTLTLNGSSDDNIFRWDGTISGNLDVTITGGDDKNIKDNSGTGDIRNLTINNSGNTINTGDGTALTIGGNLTITAGTLTTTGSDLALTVNGDVDVDGTLTANASTLTFGGHSRIDGTFARGTSTVIMDGNQGSVTNPTIRSFVGGNKFYNLICRDTATGDGVQMATDITVANDLTIEDTASLTGYIADRVLTVEGDVSIAGIFRGNRYGTGAANSFGSLTINAGNGSTTGVFQATSGTTTITSEHSGGFTFDETGTFTHNNGTVSLNSDLDSHIRANTFYNLICNGTADTRTFEWRAKSGSDLTVLNNLTVTRGELELTTPSDDLVVHGLTNIAAIGKFNNDANQTSGSITHHGLVTNLGTYKTDPITTNMNAGIRNLGTFTSADTLTIGGTGGILEGNLDDAIINVNTNAVHDLAGDNDYLYVADHNDFSFGDGSDDSAFSVSAWIYMDDATNFPIITKGAYNSTAEYAFKIQSDDKIHFWIADESVASCHLGRVSPVLTAYEGSWIHVAGTYNGNDSASSDLKIYLNGVQVDDTNDCLLYTSPSPRD